MSPSGFVSPALEKSGVPVTGSSGVPSAPIFPALQSGQPSNAGPCWPGTAAKSETQTAKAANEAASARIENWAWRFTSVLVVALRKIEFHIVEGRAANG